jgi:hypothetical protein
MQVKPRLGHVEHMAALAETLEDIEYVTSHFLPLTAVIRPAAPFGTTVPDATYRLADGSRWFARDVWRLADDAGGPEGVPGLFARRFRAACEALRYDGDLDGAWRAYLAGEYGACLRDVTPEAIVQKERLVDRLTAALAAPRPDDASWCARMRADVEALDGLEKPFASCDRTRFGATTRDRLITGARERFRDVFAAEHAEPAAS